MASNSKIIGAAAIAIIVAANVWLLWSTFGHSGPSGRREQLYFTTDDGATYFPDDASKLTPFDHDGKPAVRAHVYAVGGKKWVAYLEQNTKRGREALDALRKGQAGPEKLQGLILTEVKKPGDTRWYTPNDGKHYLDVITVVKPPGTTGEPHPVGPAD